MNAPAFQLYAQDFLTGCIFLTNEETGIYIKILTKQWTDGKIPKKRLGFLVGLNWVDFSEELQAKFIEENEFIYNKRLEFEREKMVGFHQKQAENGKKGGRPRKNTTLEKVNNDGVLEDIENPNKTQSETQTKTKKSLSSSSSISSSNVLLEKEPKEENIQKEISDETFDEVNPNSEERKKVAPKKEKYFNKDNFKKKLLDLGVEEKHANDWIQIRKDKKASFTESSIDAIVRECEKNNYPFSDAIRNCAEHNWQGFKYEWLKNRENGNNQSTNNGFSNNRNNGGKVSGTTEIISGARYTEFT